MKQGYWLFLLLLISYTSSLTAQEVDRELLISFDRTKLNLVQVPHRITEIISLGDDFAPLGVGYRGLDYTPYLLFLREGRNWSFNDLLSRTIQNQQAPEAVLRITGLTANQQIGFSAVRIKVELEAELLIPQPDGDYLAYGPVRHVQMQTGGGVIRKGAPREIAELLKVVVTELSAIATAEEGGTHLAKSELTSVRSTYPISEIRASDLPNGIFHTYMDFRAGAVDTTHDIQMRHQKTIYTDDQEQGFGKLDFDRPETLDKSEFRGIWGVQYEGQTAINLIDGNFYNLRQMEDGRFYTMIPPNFLTSRYEGSGSVAAMSGAFGLLGGLTAAAFNQIREKSEITWFDYDLASGQLISENSAREAAGGKSSLYVASSHFSKTKLKLNVERENGEMVPISPDGMIEVGDLQSFRFQIGDGKIITEAVPPAEVNETVRFARILVKGNGSYRIDWLGGESAEAEVDKLR
ncbi:hypothetical protein [Lewinella sp. 4G2]|uniref:hypothetical protein n=1 Tax=Lewinella sp. 4G2 TaxID=1803372 RepID=UPI0007B4F6AB|nr:hypothetical protein [Lewinella sp. 4G2]OAV44148.1 hypothetical protein A3850_006390 [Lewinella sp. 4G2]